MRFLPLLLLLLLLLSPMVAEGMTNCPRCHYRIQSDANECPKCLKLLRWPLAPERSRQGRVVVRTGSDAFIRDRHSQNREFRCDRNAGKDLVGAIGSWGGPTTLRYLVCFDLEKAFEQAQVELSTFQFKRATLKLYVANSGSRKGPLPIRIYPLNRRFQEGRGKIGEREKFIDGCTWAYAAPNMVWHIEGGDYNKLISSRGLLPDNGHVFIDVTEVFRYRFKTLLENGSWDDPGLIIMRDPHAYGDFGYLNIYSLESQSVHGEVRAPELFIE